MAIGFDAQDNARRDAFAAGIGGEQAGRDFVDRECSEGDDFVIDLDRDLRCAGLQPRRDEVVDLRLRNEEQTRRMPVHVDAYAA